MFDIRHTFLVVPYVFSEKINFSVEIKDKYNHCTTKREKIKKQPPINGDVLSGEFEKRR